MNGPMGVSGLRGLEARFVADAPGGLPLRVTLDAERREVTALLGARGSGTSEVLRAIAGLAPLTSGSVRVDDVDVTARAPHLRGLGLVPARLGLVGDLSVADNIRFGLTAARRPTGEQAARLAGLLDTVELSDRARDRVADLPYVDRLRVAVARAVTTEPSLLLLDDPLGELHDGEREGARRVLRTLLQSLPVTALLATDDVADAVAIASTVAVLEDGAIVQSGPTRDVIGAPASTRIASLLGYEVLIEGYPDGAQLREPGVGEVAVPAHASSDVLVQLMAHPAALLAVPRGHGLGFGVSGTVVHTRPVGPSWAVEVALGARATVLVRWEWDPEPPADGATVELIATGIQSFFDGRRRDAPGTGVLAAVEPVEVLSPVQSSPAAPTPPGPTADLTAPLVESGHHPEEDDPRPLPLSGTG